MVGFSFHIAQCDAAGRAGRCPSHALDDRDDRRRGVSSRLLAARRRRRVYREDAGDGSDVLPRGRRLQFLAILGMTISPLFLCIILMRGLGATLIDTCRQS